MAGTVVLLTVCRWVLRRNGWAVKTGDRWDLADDWSSAAWLRSGETPAWTRLRHHFGASGLPHSAPSARRRGQRGRTTSRTGLRSTSVSCIDRRATCAADAEPCSPTRSGSSGSPTASIRRAANEPSSIIGVVSSAHRLTDRGRARTRGRQSAGMRRSGSRAATIPARWPARFAAGSPAASPPRPRYGRSAAGSPTDGGSLLQTIAVRRGVDHARPSGRATRSGSGGIRRCPTRTSGPRRRGPFANVTSSRRIDPTRPRRATLT